MYKYSHQVSDDFILDILHIDETVFEPTARGTENSLLARYNANRESYILVYDESQIVGYLAFFPISNDLSMRILNEDKPFDDNIQAEDILPEYVLDNCFDMFIISIAILPEYNGRGIGRELMGMYFGFIREKINIGCQIRKTYSYAFTDAGSKILAKFGFDEVKSIKCQDADSVVKLMQYEF